MKTSIAEERSVMVKKNDPSGKASRVSLEGKAVNFKKSSVAQSAFGYYGAKQKLAKKILDHLPPHHCWVELFCGSAAITMAKPPAEIEIINDLDHEIVNAFRQLRERPEALIMALELTPYAREEFQIAMKDEGKKVDDLERARRFLSRAMMAVNGILAKSKGGFSFTNSFSRNGKEARVSRWTNYPKRLEAVALRLRDVRVESVDGIKLLREFSSRPASLVYIDPPYFTARSAGYTVDAEDVDFHTNLLRQANASKCMILISSYDSELYNKLLSEGRGWTKVNLGAFTRDTNGSSFEREEILWINAAAKKARQNNKVPIRLSTKEKHERKINPVRGSIRKT